MENFKYSDYVSENLDKDIKYSEYIAESLDTINDYSDYIAESLKRDISYSEYFETEEYKNKMKQKDRGRKIDELLGKTDD